MVRFTTKKIDSLTLGERMKKMREDRRLTIAEVSKGTKIQAKYLEYLEGNECSKLPADVYVKGFLRSYAIFMGVNEKVLIKQYEREKGIQKNLKRIDSEIDSKKTVSFSNFVVTPGIVVAGAVILVVLGSIFYLYREVDSFISAPRLLILKPQDGLNIDASSTNVSGVAEKDALVFINDQPVLVNENGQFSEDVGLKEGVNTITVRAKNKFQKEASQSVTVNVPVKDNSQEDNSSGSNTPDNSISASQPVQASVPISVEVSVGSDPTWISVEADGNLVYSGTLLAQSKQTFSANDNVKITSGKGSATFIKVNGKDMGMLSNDPGVVRDVEYNAQGRVEDNNNNSK
jgi:cytoskeleton protein RodZ